MNESTMRERARERMLDAQLATVLDAPLAGTAGARGAGDGGRRLAVAALVLLGCAVAIGVAWTRTGGADEVQDPRGLDPVAPWHERFWPMTDGFLEIENADDVARFVDYGDQATVGVDKIDEPFFDELLASPGLHQLRLSARGLSRVNPFDAARARAVAESGALESLSLWNLVEVEPAALRELRRSTSLQHLTLMNSPGTFDLATARAVCEIPRLRGLTIGVSNVASDALEALLAAPHLQVLALIATNYAEDPGPSLRRLRQLRVLLIEGRKELSFLRDMDQLRQLSIGLVDVHDEDLAVLPKSLEALRLPIRSATVDGIRSLRRLQGLRSLTITEVWFNTKIEEALADVVKATPLERLELLVQVPGDALWQALAARPRLRVLRLRAQGPGESEVVRRAATLPRLEHLSLTCQTLPTPDAVRALAALEHLRSVTFFLPQQDTSLLTDRITELRTILGDRVTLSVSAIDPRVR